MGLVLDIPMKRGLLKMGDGLLQEFNSLIAIVRSHADRLLPLCVPKTQEANVIVRALFRQFNKNTDRLVVVLPTKRINCLVHSPRFGQCRWQYATWPLVQLVLIPVVVLLRPR